MARRGTAPEYSGAVLLLAWFFALNLRGYGCSDSGLGGVNRPLVQHGDNAAFPTRVQANPSRARASWGPCPTRCPA